MKKLKIEKCGGCPYALKCLGGGRGCAKTGKRITRNIKNGTINKHCPLEEYLAGNNKEEVK